MDGFSIALSGLQAAATGIGVTSNNVANVNSKDFKAQRLNLEEQREGGVKATGTTESQEPTTPNGSNVDLATEFTSLMTQADTYKASLKVAQTQSQILGQAFDLKA